LGETPVQEKESSFQQRTVQPVTEAVAIKTYSRAAELPRRIDILAIGVSTGGPNALAKFIPLLPDNLNIPIVLVQHMPPMFTKSLADHLNSKSKLAVVEASDREILESNKVYIAPGGKHMILEKENNMVYLKMDDSPPVNSCKPSVDKLFESIPRIYKGNILSVIMTGMGADGLNGVKTLKRAGCYSITQTADSCVVYGMPRVVVEAGVSDEAVNLDDLARRVTEIIKKMVY